jgi:hypothetical protein
MTFESKRRAFGAAPFGRPPLRGPKGDKGNPGPAGAAGESGRLLGTYHVEDPEFGAVSRGIGDTVSAEDQTANTIAIQAALDAVFATGGTLYFGGTGEAGQGSVYHTNGPVGYVVGSADTNAMVRIVGLAPFPGALIYCSSTTEPNFTLHATLPNIRTIDVENMQFFGGRTAVSCIYLFYSRFTKCWFWGAEQFALQMYVCGELVFTDCLFTETGMFGDAMYLVGSQATFANCTYGEAGGGIVCDSCTLEINGGTMQAGCYYRGSDATDYWTVPGSPADIDLAFYAGEESQIIAISSNVKIVGLFSRVAKIGLSLDLAQSVVLSGVQWLCDGAAFEGFVNVMRNTGTTALKIDGQFQWDFQTGYFIKEVAALLHDSVITAQLIDNFGTITALGTSAPALVNPGTENNLVTTRTFVRA